MKIIYYSPHPTHDIVSEVGYATHQREVINALKAQGHQVIPVIMGGTEPGNLSPQGVTASPRSFKAILKKIIPRFLWTTLKDYKLTKHDTRAAAELEKAIIQHQPDLVYERSEYLQDKGVGIIKKYGVKYFLEVNAPFVEEMNGFEGYSMMHKAAHRKEKNKLAAADKVFVVSSALSDFLIVRYQCNADKIVLQPNCINPASVQTDESFIHKLKTTHNLYGKSIVGFVGSIFPHHGVDVMIEGFSMLAKQYPQMVLIIVGDGSIVQQLKSITETAQLQDRVLFLGKQPHQDIYNYISLMDICIMAKSNWYGSPIKIFEYGILGKPVIAPDTIPVRDVMDNGTHGLLIETTAGEVAGAIIKLIENRDLRDSVANNFKELIIANYTWDKAAKTIAAQAGYNHATTGH